MKEIKYSTVDDIHIYKLCKPIFIPAINLALLEKTQGEITQVVLYFQETTCTKRWNFAAYPISNVRNISLNITFLPNAIIR